MGRLVYILVGERLLALDVQALASQFMRLDVSEPSRVLACIVARSFLLERIRERQYDYPHLLVLRDKVRYSDAKQVIVGDDGVLRIHVRVCVPNLNGLRQLILEEGHSSRYSIHPVKYEHQRPGGLLQKIEIPEWKWKRITIDFVVGFPQTRRKFDEVWVIVDGLTKSAHFIPMVVSYYSEQLAEIYIREIVHLHGINCSLVSLYYIVGLSWVIGASWYTLVGLAV
ncbi:uncharacterized protein [Nicotiana sylvestris]|uniref:uncharacterized protein n=1 Tax=Nicotiana sylvestris TaxID=4096 RepID=UPI00388C674C